MPSQLPVYITEFSISGLDPAKHAYEMEKFLRIAFSHDAVAGITMADLWDKGSSRQNSGIYAANKQPKPAAAKLDKLWREEWHTEINERMHSDGTLDFEGFYGTYQYQLMAGDQVCTGVIDLNEVTPRRLLSCLGLLIRTILKNAWTTFALPNACRNLGSIPRGPMISVRKTLSSNAISRARCTYLFGRLLLVSLWSLLDASSVAGTSGESLFTR